MTFALTNVVPWGRSFDEYVAMFALTEADLLGRIVGCGDGPASFNATATSHGYAVVSADPIYAFSAAQIRERVEATTPVIAAEIRANSDEFVWTHFKAVDELIDARLAAMRVFLDDFPGGLRSGRYVNAALPSLPFGARTFDLALSSHFLFLYSQQHDLAFHVAAIRELTRIAGDVRIFPLFELGAVASRHLADVTDTLTRDGCLVERVRVHYEFQKGGNEMLRILASPDRP